MKSSERSFLAFDIGATSGRAMVGTFSENDFRMSEIYRFPNSIKESEGRFYWDTEELFGHLRKALKAAGESGLPISSIGIDTWGVDFGFIGTDGRPEGEPRAYRDPYTEGIPSKVFEIIPRKELYGATGIQIMNFNSIFQLYAQKEEGFGPLKTAGKILFMPDLLSFFLTGKAVCEYTIASTSQMINPLTRQFDKSLLERLGIRSSILPELTDPGTVIGHLKKEIALETGLGEIPVIAVAGHDTASAIAAVPACDEEFAYLSSGTWSLMGIESPKPIINDKSETYNFTNEGGIEGTTRFLKNITGMWLLERCKSVWEAEGRSYSYAQIVSMAAEASDFESTINPDDEAFANPKDMVSAIRGSLSSSGRRVPENDAQIVAVIFHSLSKRYKEVLAMLKGFAPFDIKTLHIIGGGSANELLNQMTADATGLTVIAGPSEATAIGNIMIQAKAAGIVKDRWEMRRIIAETFKVKTYKPKNN